MVFSAITVDQILRTYDSQPDSAIEADDTLELHLSNIARVEYVARTGNLGGRKAVSEIQPFLLPQAVCDVAAKHRTIQVNLQNSLRSTGKGTGKGAVAAAFAPHSQRVCNGSGQTGHVLVDCPNITPEEKIKKSKELAEAKARGKRGSP